MVRVIPEENVKRFTGAIPFIPSNDLRARGAALKKNALERALVQAEYCF